MTVLLRQVVVAHHYSLLRRNIPKAIDEEAIKGTRIVNVHASVDTMKKGVMVTSFEMPFLILKVVVRL